jgi:hypothetical protein
VYFPLEWICDKCWWWYVDKMLEKYDRETKQKTVELKKFNRKKKIAKNPQFHDDVYLRPDVMMHDRPSPINSGHKENAR